MKTIETKTIETHHIAITEPLYNNYLQAISDLALAFNHTWFVNELDKRGLFNYLKYVAHSQLVNTYLAILLAFKCSGTEESIISLSRAFFGKTCQIEIRVIEPNRFSLHIKNANKRLVYALAINKANTNHALVVNNENKYAFSINYYGKAVGDVLTFFRDFVAVGSVLEFIEIT